MIPSVNNSRKSINYCQKNESYIKRFETYFFLVLVMLIYLSESKQIILLIMSALRKISI